MTKSQGPIRITIEPIPDAEGRWEQILALLTAEEEPTDTPRHPSESAQEVGPPLHADGKVHADGKG